jgi:beta-galactosidase GanA
MQAILATLTAVLPVWMVEKHPDILYSHEHFGGRRHGCHTSPVLADYTRKVVRRCRLLPDRARRRGGLAADLNRCRTTGRKSALANPRANRRR